MIYLTITNASDNVNVVDEQMETYDELVNRVKALKPLIVSIENGGEGVSICKKCGGETTFGDDPQADAGMECNKCTNE